jgi:hypothetical protein
MTIVEITGGMLLAVAQYVSAYDARADSEMLSTDFCRGVIPATSWRVVYKGDAPDFVEVGEAGIAMDDAMRRQRRVQLVG